MTLLDKDIREPLFDWLEEQYGRIRILEEKETGRSRADAVMVTENSLYGIEIKSDADSYARLKRQVRDYSRFYDYCYIAVGSTHAMHVAEHVPYWWGIISVELYQNKIDFYLVRPPERNEECSIENKLSLLWRPELAVIQERFGMHAYKEKSKAFVQEKILQTLDRGELDSEISRTLFERDYTQISRQINEYRRTKGKRARRKPPKRRK